MSEEAAFLEVLKANPADDTARLVYADWLDEHNEPAKAEYLRAMVALVRLPGGSAEYTDAAVQLYQACVRTDSAWRREAGERFDVLLKEYRPGHKIQTIKIVRELTGCGLAESKALVESTPTPLRSWLTFEGALPYLLAFHGPRWTNEPNPVSVILQATAWPEGGAPNAVFDVFICEHNFDFDPDSANYGLGYAVRGLSSLLGITEGEAREHLQKLPTLVGSGLPPTAVADFVRQLKLICNVYNGLPPNGIRVVPRIATA